MKNWHFYFNKTRNKITFGMGVVLCVTVMLLGCHFYMNAILPEKIYITANEEQNITVPIPWNFSCDSSALSSKMVDGVYTIYSNETGQYELSFQLFGI